VTGSQPELSSNCQLSDISIHFSDRPLTFNVSEICIQTSDKADWSLRCDGVKKALGKRAVMNPSSSRRREQPVAEIVPDTQPIASRPSKSFSRDELRSSISISRTLNPEPRPAGVLAQRLHSQSVSFECDGPNPRHLIRTRRLRSVSIAGALFAFLPAAKATLVRVVSSHGLVSAYDRH
jgi:hypothetical protein